MCKRALMAVTYERGESRINIRADANHTRRRTATENHRQTIKRRYEYRTVRHGHRRENVITISNTAVLTTYHTLDSLTRVVTNSRSRDTTGSRSSSPGIAVAPPPPQQSGLQPPSPRQSNLPRRETVERVRRPGKTAKMSKGAHGRGVYSTTVGTSAVGGWAHARPTRKTRLFDKPYYN